MVEHCLQVRSKTIWQAVRLQVSGGKGGFGAYRAKTMETKKSGGGQQFKAQVHIRTPSDASHLAA